MYAETEYPRGYIRLVQDMYQGATTRVKSKRGMSEHFEVGTGLHQVSALSPFLFIMLVDTISQDVRTELPWELLYADDLAIIDISSCCCCCCRLLFMISSFVAAAS